MPDLSRSVAQQFGVKGHLFGGSLFESGSLAQVGLSFLQGLRSSTYLLKEEPASVEECLHVYQIGFEP